MNSQRPPAYYDSQAPDSLYEIYRSVYEENDLVFEDEPGHVNILGIRGLLPGRILTDNEPDEYNDTICFLWQDEDGSYAREFKASVDPGEYYTSVELLNDNGCAHLLDGQYEYKIGLHRGKYEALVQAGPVTVSRDLDQDHQCDEGEIIEDGDFGINIHAGGSGTEVGQSSAGCQIIFGGVSGSFYQEAQSIWNLHPADTIVYTLLDRAYFGHSRCEGVPDDLCIMI